MTSENTAPVSEREWVMVPFGGPVTLLDCPPGPFLFDGCLGFRSEYATTTPRNRYQPDAYVMDSGEYFWGGTSDTLERSQLIVQPLVAKARQIAALQGSEGGHAGKLESAPTGGASHLLGGERARLVCPECGGDGCFDREPYPTPNGPHYPEPQVCRRCDGSGEVPAEDGGDYTWDDVG